ncbi:MFS transporter [Paracoccus sp. TK19116]|uniref:MFS transporter n=1 Tax=Paracoccus albicereus TaxID=2922394 RepID=A0ABT1MUN8_9RHOB|nr:MFS transporter [Paracoccus albicereus]MCQ0970576.1 MFS transporter [Paracoccus albicereus]
MSQGAGAAPAPATGRWRALALICGAVVLSMTPWFSATAILPELTARWHLDEAAASWLTIAVQLGFVTGALGLTITGLADRVRMQRLIGMAAALAAAANLILLVAPGPATAIASRLLTGAALAGVYPPAMKLVTTWFVAGRGLALGFVIGALTLGSAFPHLIRAASAGFDWRIVVIATSGFAALSALLLGAVAREGPHGYAQTTFRLGDLRRIVLNKPLMLANTGYFGHMWELYAMWGWFLAFLSGALALSGTGSPVLTSAATFAVIAAGAIGCVAGGWMADRIGRTATTALMMGISGGCAAMIGFVYAGPLWLLLIVALVWGVTIVADSAQFSAMVTELADRSLVGTALAFQMGVGFGLTIISLRLMPSVAGWLGSWQWAFLVLVPGPAIGTAAMLALRRLPEANRIGGGRR